ncbi:AAA family ATPase [Abyssicoccus albus]|uniref:Nuclease SbcCD subunit C n=1 Tax=Abyssicoccus albus TaxID=1817405 RepID=A0A3N5C6H9_9BACL|nr:SMC family ATPase [Abyssicoccus albus]RPF57938.1 exonuclease SbcC [Abyssicoccus albus]
MKPIHLTIKNIGPYRNESIDFTEVNEQGIYIVNGPTGAGKTFIFDAITYALYRDTSTSTRDFKAMRSKFVEGTNEVSKIQLLFEYGTKYYYIDRQLSYTKPENKNETKEQCAMFEVQVNDQYEIINQHLLADSVSSINETVHNILHLTIDQFRKVFILPQGEFKALLHARTEERMKLLRTIFDTERFESLMNVINKDKKKIEQTIISEQNIAQSTMGEIVQTIKNLTNDSTDVEAIEKINESQAGQYDNINSTHLKTTIDVSEQFMKQSNERMNALTRALPTKEKEVNTYRNQLSQAEQREALINEIRSLEVQWHSLIQSDHTSMLQLHQQIELFKKEKTYEHDLTQYVEMIEQRDRYANDLNSLSEQIIKTEESIQDEKETLNNLQRKKPDIEQKKTIFTQNTLFYENKDKIKNAIRNVDPMSKKLDEMNEHIEEKTTRKKELIKTIESLKQQSQSMMTLYEQKDKFSKKLLSYESQLTQLKQLQRYSKEYGQKESQQEEIDHQLIKLQKDLKSYFGEVFETINADQVDAYITLKAFQDNSQHDQCILCHQHIEHQHKEHHDLNFLKEKDGLVNKLFTNYHDTKKKMNQLSNEMSILKKQYEDILDSLKKDNARFNVSLTIESSHHDVSTVNDFIEHVTERIEHFKTEMERVTNNIEQREKDIKEIDSLNQQVDEINRQLESLMTQDKVELQQQLKQYKSTIDDFQTYTKYDDIDLFIQEMTRYNDESKLFSREYEAANEKIEEKSQIIQQLNSNKKAKEELLNQLNRDISERKEDINHILKQFQYNDPTDMLNNIKQSNIESMDRVYQRYIKEKEALKSKILTKKQMLKGVPNYNKELVIERLNQSEHQLKNFQNEHISLQKDLDQLNRQHEKLLTQYNDFIEIERTNRMIRKTYLTLNGHNKMNLKLESYVLKYYFQRVLISANKRLLQLTSNRYEFINEKVSNQGGAGLEIQVLDHYNNEIRKATTLSGGETFLASLCLALGLSDVIISHQGGIKMDTLFIDEGFGTLDEETLEKVNDVLEELRNDGKHIGLISHVREMKEQFPAQIKVHKHIGYSTIELIH